MQRYAITEVTPDVQVRAWARAGVEWVQLRDHMLAPADLCRHAERLARLLQASGGPTRLLVNGLPPQLALNLGAHGVHLRSGATSAAVAQAKAAGAAVSVSCHTLSEVHAACGGAADLPADLVADLVLWAPVFAKTVSGRQVAPGSGLTALAQACRAAAGTPVFALGGVTAQNAEACLAAGATGIAGIRLFAGEDWRALSSGSSAWG